MNRRLYIPLVLAILIGLAGCGGGTPGNHPPDVHNVGVDRSFLEFEGGPVTITAQATDPDGDDLTVQAEVKKPDGQTDETPLPSDDGSPYRFIFPVPGNPTTTTQIYEIRVTASDGEDRDTDPPLENDPIRLTVNPAEAPPGQVQF